MILEIKQIQEIIPHRYPFLLIDRILELEPGRRAVGIKNVTINEQFFQGHFPGYPVWPGVLTIEALAQVGTVLALYPEENRGRIALFAGIDKLKFRRQVVPGDQLRLEVELTKFRDPMGISIAKAYVGDQLAVEGILKFALGPKADSV